MRYLAFAANCALLGALLVDTSFATTRGLSAEAFASFLSAFGTLVLASFTWRSVEISKEAVRATFASIDNENDNYRVTTTVNIISQYNQVLIQATKDLALRQLLPRRKYFSIQKRLST